MDLDEDEFDLDDDLDALPADALEVLETTAFRATQHQQSYYEPQGASDYGVDDDDGQFDQVINPLNDIAEPAPAAWPGNATPQAGGNGTAYGYSAMDVDEAPRRSQADPNQLLQRIKKLEQEKARLSREVQDERSRLQVKTGETETARRRLEAATRDNERRIAALQQSHNEAVAKHKAELEKLRREREQAQTNTMFLEHDLAREAEKARRAARNVGTIPMRNRMEPVPSPAATPKRQQKTLPLRDGFDDEDLVMVSPSKRDRPKTSTPKQTSKRKRQVADQSPIPALQLSEPRPALKAQESTSSLEGVGAAFLASLRKEDRRFELLHHLVNTRSPRSDDRLVEALIQYALPSNPGKKLSSSVCDELAKCTLEQDAQGLAIRICDVFITIWSQCLQERYNAPIHLCVSALHHILAYESCSVAIAIAPHAIPVILSSVDLVAFPIARACMQYITPADLYSPAQQKINSEIDVTNCLDLLHTIATSCVTNVEAITQFWTLIPIDFPLHLLRKSQPLGVITRMLSLLSTSTLPDSLGPRVLDAFGAEQQEKRETDLIDRLTKLLSDTPSSIPQPSTSPKPKHFGPSSNRAVEKPAKMQYASKQIISLRLHIVKLLASFAHSPYGSTRLANLKYCIGRLIAFLDAQVSSLYTPAISLASAFPTAAISTASTSHSLTISSINTTMLLLSHLKATNPTLDIKAKLSVIPGGEHKYLVALTRLAFSERLVLEKGVAKETVDAAYAVLDAGLTPEEGEGLLAVMASSGAAAGGVA